MFNLFNKKRKVIVAKINRNDVFDLIKNLKNYVKKSDESNARFINMDLFEDKKLIIKLQIDKGFKRQCLKERPIV